MSLRDSMPHAAALVDEARALFGRELVDAALRRGMALQREHAAMAAQAGAAAADAWLATQRAAQPVFAVREGNRTVGVMPGCNPAPLRWRSGR